jgi:membrane-bound serine protease (ClpP class)
MAHRLLFKKIRKKEPFEVFNGRRKARYVEQTFFGDVPLLRDPAGRNCASLLFRGPGGLGILCFDSSLPPAPFPFYEENGSHEFARGRFIPDNREGRKIESGRLEGRATYGKLADPFRNWRVIVLYDAAGRRRNGVLRRTFPWRTFGRENQVESQRAGCRGKRQIRMKGQSVWIAPPSWPSNFSGGMMNPKRFFLPLLFLGLSGLLLLSFPWPSSALGRQVKVIKINDAITPAIADFVREGIQQSSREKAELLIIQMDTPGGLDLSMRDIIKHMLNSSIPIAVYVSPSGARAASAGVFITLASDIAAMAPGTNIGAAHPVAMGGQMDRTMNEKVTNDAVAYVQSLAAKKGRNGKWAAQAVRESVSITETEALRLQVIDLVAKDMDDLLARIDGKTVEKSGKAIKLDTKGAQVQFVEMGLRERILTTLANPNIAYILMMIGLVGLYFELSNPGAIFPGVIGGISLILSFLAFRTLPVNYGGFLLILLGVVLFIAEIKVASYGLLTVGGILSLALGSIMLFDSPLPYLRASLLVIIPTVLATAAFFILAVTISVKALTAKPATGPEGLVAEIGRAETRLAPNGKVFIHGEFWNAYSKGTIEEGEKIRVLGTEGLVLKVEKMS